MLIKSITGVAEIADIQIQKSISHLLFVKKGTANKVVAERITVGLKMQSGGEQVIIPNTKVDDVAILSQFENGYILEQLLAGGNVEYAGLLELTQGAAIRLDNNNYLSVDLKSLEAAATYEIYGLESILEGTTFLKYTSREIVGANPQQIQVGLGSNSVNFAIRNNGALSKVRLFTPNGRQVTYTPVELACLAREMNGMTKGPDKLIEGDAINQAFSGGAVDFFIIPTGAFSNLELETVGGTNLEYISVNLFTY